MGIQSMIFHPYNPLPDLQPLTGSRSLYLLLYPSTLHQAWKLGTALATCSLNGGAGEKVFDVGSIVLGWWSAHMVTPRTPRNPLKESAGECLPRAEQVAAGCPPAPAHCQPRASLAGQPEGPGLMNLGEPEQGG